MQSLIWLINLLFRHKLLVAIINVLYTNIITIICAIITRQNIASG